MPDSTGFGDYTESGQVIPVSFDGEVGSYTHQMFLNDHPPIAGGREIWGFPKQLAQPSLAVETDTMVGTLDYGSVRIATGSMGHKHRPPYDATKAGGLCAPTYQLKSIPRVEGTTPVCALMRFTFAAVTLRRACTPPAARHLTPHHPTPLP